MKSFGVPRMKETTRSSENKPLWGAEDQAARLVELTSDSPDVKEAPLRRDVRSLGRLLGEVLKEQAGESLFNAVEEIRQLAIEYRPYRHSSRSSIHRRIVVPHRAG